MYRSFRGPERSQAQPENTVLVKSIKYGSVLTNGEFSVHNRDEWTAIMTTYTDGSTAITQRGSVLTSGEFSVHARDWTATRTRYPNGSIVITQRGSRLTNGEFSVHPRDCNATRSYPETTPVFPSTVSATIEDTRTKINRDRTRW